MVGVWAYFFGLGYDIPHIVRDIRFADDFAGHYILGPVVVVGWSLVPTAIGTVTALKTAPSNRLIVVIVLAVLLGSYLLLSGIGFGLLSAEQDSLGERLIRLVLQAGGHIAGFIVGVAGYYFKEDGFDDERPSHE